MSIVKGTYGTNPINTETRL